MTNVHPLLGPPPVPSALPYAQAIACATALAFACHRPASPTTDGRVLVYARDPADRVALLARLEPVHVARPLPDTDLIIEVLP